MTCRRERQLRTLPLSGETREERGAYVPSNQAHLSLRSRPAGFLDPCTHQSNSNVAPSENFVVFSLDAGRYALSLPLVERVVPAVELTPLPEAPDVVLGVFSLHGRIIPAMDVRRRFHLPSRAIGVADQFIIAMAAGRALALVVDGTLGIVQRAAEEIVGAETILAELPYVRGVFRLPDGIVVIHDLPRFLSLEEAQRLDSALQGIGRS